MNEIKTFDDMMNAVLAIFPNAQLEEDNYGQIIVYTDLSLDSKDNVVPFEDFRDSEDAFDVLEHLQQRVMKKNKD
jgi:hypothetical protein